MHPQIESLIMQSLMLSTKAPVHQKRLTCVFTQVRENERLRIYSRTHQARTQMLEATVNARPRDPLANPIEAHNCDLRDARNTYAVLQWAPSQTNFWPLVGCF